MTTSVQLISPSARFESSYGGYVQELTSLDEKPVPFVLGYTYDTFEELLRKLDDDTKAELQLPGRVPCTTFWLVEDQTNEVVGVSNLRHSLNDKLLEVGGHIGFGIRPSARKRGYGTRILAETLIKAKDFGISKALVTCSKANVGSAGVIKNNGGILEDERYNDELGEVVQRYWIPLPTS